MHTLTIQTEFTFGDRVEFDSRLQGCSGVGTIYAITIDDQMHVDYIIAVEAESALRAGIQEHEITLAREMS
jgi:hypothetical protein